MFTNVGSEYVPRLDENGNPIPKSERRPKKKVVCMIGYCGTGYNGMQIQNSAEVKTIENDLFQGFIQAGAISLENSDDLKKNGFMRAARTDKGVHAAGNVISCKLIIEDPDILTKINEKLPDQIRVWGIERVNKSFDCRKLCSSRVYEYLLPTFSFLPPKPGSILDDQLKSESDKHPGFYKTHKDGETFWNDVFKSLEQLRTSFENEGEQSLEQNNEQLAKKIKKLEHGARKRYRITSEKLQLFRNALKMFEGSHNFHNYTIGKSFNDSSSRRFMKSLTASDPFIINETEWVSIKIHGQSFMLHQIRKMIAMAVLIIRTGCPESRIEETFSSTKVNIPKAPALGLLLESPVYEGYNPMLEKFGYNTIDFTKYVKEMNDFKHKFIYDKIYDEELRDNVFYGFFGFIDNLRHNEHENVFKFLNSEFEEGKEDKVKDQIKFDNVD